MIELYAVTDHPTAPLPEEVAPLRLVPCRDLAAVCAPAHEAEVSPEALWRHWADMAAWPQWNDGIEAIDVEGPFAVGTTFTMTPPGDQPIRMRLVEIEPGTSFTDEMDAGDFVVRTEHRLEPAAGGLTRIVYRTQITGAAADSVGPELGPQITADFPEVVAALAGRAEG